MIKTGMDGCAALIGLHLTVHSSTVELWHRFQKLVTKIVSQARAIVFFRLYLSTCLLSQLGQKKVKPKI